MAALTSAAALLAACGGSGSTGSSSRSALAAVRCMRTHGVPNFPDPAPRGGFSVNFAPGGTVQINDINFGGPAFQAAARVCKPLGPGRGGPGPVPEQQRRGMLVFASCMRHHGFPEWADPTFPAGGGVMGGGGPYAKSTPGLMPAVRTCNGIAFRQAGG